MFGPDRIKARKGRWKTRRSHTVLMSFVAEHTHGATAERTLWNNSLTRPSSIQSWLKTKSWWNKEILHSTHEAHMVKLLSRHPGSLPSQVHTFTRTDSLFLGGQKLMQGMITRCGVYSYHQLRKWVWERPRTMCLLSRNTTPIYIIARSPVDHSRVSLNCGR